MIRVGGVWESIKRVVFFFSVSEQVQSSKELIEKWPSKPTVTGWIGDWRGFSDGSKLRLGSHLV